MSEPSAPEPPASGCPTPPVSTKRKAKNERRNRANKIKHAKLRAVLQETSVGDNTESVDFPPASIIQDRVPLPEYPGSLAPHTRQPAYVNPFYKKISRKKVGAGPGKYAYAVLEQIRKQATEMLGADPAEYEARYTALCAYLHDLHHADHNQKMYIHATHKVISTHIACLQRYITYACGKVAQTLANEKVFDKSLAAHVDHAISYYNTVVPPDAQLKTFNGLSNNARQDTTLKP